MLVSSVFFRCLIILHIEEYTRTLGTCPYYPTPHPRAILNYRWRCQTSVRRVWPVVLHLYSSAVTLVLVSERRTWQTSSRSLPSEYPSIKQLDSVGETTETPRNRLSALRIDPGSARLFKRAPNQQSGLLLIWWVHIAQRNSQYVS